MKITERYQINKGSKVGVECMCPSCGTTFVKTNYQQAFCKTRKGTKCKDKYWNTVDPKKRCNRTRISPASRSWLAKKAEKRYENFDPHDYEHPFSSEALGQWE